MIPLAILANRYNNKRTDNEDSEAGQSSANNHHSQHKQQQPQNTGLLSFQLTNWFQLIFFVKILCEA